MMNDEVLEIEKLQSEAADLMQEMLLKLMNWMRSPFAYGGRKKVEKKDIFPCREG